MILRSAFSTRNPQNSRQFRAFSGTFSGVAEMADSMAEGAGFELTVRFLATLKLKALVRVDRSVASATNGNQVFLAIGSAMAAKAKGGVLRLPI